MNTNKPQRITQDDVATVAAESVTRALAVREQFLRQLSPEEIAAVGGGAASLLFKGLINGGRPVDYLANFATPQFNPAADLGGLNTGLATLTRTV